MKILFVGADAGGCRSLWPVLDEMRRLGHSVLVADHGFWKGKDRLNKPDEEVLQIISSGDVDILAFSTSVKDIFPLTVARHCRERGIPTFCMLDSWVNYRSRLEIDGKGLYIPDIYAMMDEEAYNETLVEGFPESALAITGQPAFSSLEQKPLVAGPEGRRTVLFISEPVEMDQGGNDSFPDYRGYTEKVVFPLFCRSTQPYADDLFILVAPHPREETTTLERLWNKHRGHLEGKLLTPGEGRREAFSCYGVAGMASILLYEAWLLGIPVLSIQPEVRRYELSFILRCNGVLGAKSTDGVPAATAAWANSLQRGRRTIRPELEFHRNAVKQCVTLIESLWERKKDGGL